MSLASWIICLFQHVVMFELFLKCNMLLVSPQVQQDGVFIEFCNSLNVELVCQQHLQE